MSEPKFGLDLAIVCLNDGQPERAQQLCGEVLNDTPKDPRAWHLRGVACAQLDDFATAATCFENAVQYKPQVANYHYNLALAYRSLGRFDDAVTSYRAAIQRKPDFLEAHNNLGNTLLAQDDLKGAKACFESLVDRFPDNGIGHYNLANVLQDIGEFDASIVAFRRAIELDPDRSSARENLGRALSDVRAFDEAKRVWEEWLEYDNGNPIATHMLVSITGEGIPSRCDDDFVRESFNADFAESFDEQLDRIDYRGPQLMKEAVERLEIESGSADVLDAGCGTGLSGPMLAPLARRLVGVDLSPDMLTVAKRWKVYDELVECELTHYLTESPQMFDLVVCSDTLCYFGDLHEIMHAARDAIRNSGMYVFSVESFPSGDELDAPNAEARPRVAESFELQANGRYRHVKDYVASCLEAAGFSIIRSVSESLRKERGRDVPGMVFTCRVG